MVKHPSSQAVVETEAVPAVPVEQELTLLRGFRDLVGQRWGLFMGRTLQNSDLSEKTETERKAANEVRKDIKTNLPTWIKNADSATYEAKTAELKTAGETLKKAKDGTGIPEKVKALSQGLRYLDNDGVPKAYEQVSGQPVAPIFSLPQWIADRLEEQKKAKKRK